jgi:glycosyl transferase family 25
LENITNIDNNKLLENITNVDNNNSLLENNIDTSKSINKFDFINKVIYINLEKRVDRKTSVEKELLLYFPQEKIVRFNAFYENNGPIGCTKSHIGAIEMAIENKWKNCLIVEDDIEWIKEPKFTEMYNLFKKLFKNPFDVILLNSYNMRRYDKKTYRVTIGSSTAAYLCHHTYYTKLLENFKKGLELLIEYRKTNELDINKRFCEYNIDEYWKKLQAKDRWYSVVPSLCIQKDGYSDCTKLVQNYGKNKFS